MGCIGYHPFAAGGSNVVIKYTREFRINIIRRFIKENYLDMYRMWKEFGGGDFYQG